MDSEAKKLGAELEGLIELLDREIAALACLTSLDGQQRREAYQQMRARVERTAERLRNAPTAQFISMSRCAVELTRGVLDGTFGKRPSKEFLN